MSRTAPLTSKRCILYIYATNIRTEYFQHALYSPFFSSKCSLFHNANLFGSCIIHILYTGCAKIKKKIWRQRVNLCVCLRPTAEEQQTGCYILLVQEKVFPSILFDVAVKSVTAVSPTSR